MKPPGAEVPGAEPARDSTHLTRQRFVEALRRAEIITLVNAAEDAAGLGSAVSEELSEAFDAEISFVAHRGPGDGWEVLGAVGLGRDDAAWLVAPQDGDDSPAAQATVAAGGVSIAGLGEGISLRASHAGHNGGMTHVGVICLYETDFSDAERALLAAVTTNVGHALERFWAEADRDRLLAESREAAVATATALANALEARDDYTAGHAEMIAGLAVEVAERLGLEGDDLDRVRWGAIFHDIGKIAVPDEILRKPGPLSPEEQALMRGHALAGEKILEPVAFLEDVRPLVRHSHERWDGNGYPDGLSGEEIPLGARIICVVDAWHAMISERVYSAAMPLEDAAAELRRHAGTQFDPAIVDTFLDSGPWG